jgi:hypothetical protein
MPPWAVNITRMFQVPHLPAGVGATIAALI